VDSQHWPAARRNFVAAFLLFVITIVIGILNGLDVYSPDHDTLITHVHAGTLGWITMGVSGIALLMFGGRMASPAEVNRGNMLSWAVIGAITLYVAAFFAGDRIPGDRIWRPIFGTVLLLVVIWFLVWLTRQYREGGRSVAKLGLYLAWISLLIGAVFGIVLGIYTSQGEVPGLGDDTAAAIAEAHPPAMVIGFLILAAMAVIEWLFRGNESWTKAGATHMWLLFVAGVMINIGFITGAEEALLGPANLLMIVGILMLVGRSWAQMKPSGWAGSGTGAYPRVAVLFLLVYLVLGTTLIVLIVSETMDIDALTEAEEGLLLTFDHSMFIGVMTMLVFGTVSSRLHGTRATTVDRIVHWGVPIGLVLFGIGLMTVEALPKQIGTPIMGTALLIGIVAYIRAIAARTSNPMRSMAP
jgi:hypothetical protein